MKIQKKMIKQGNESDIIPEWDSKTLYWACRCFPILEESEKEMFNEFVDMLLKRGVSPFEICFLGRSPLFGAVEAGYTYALNLILSEDILKKYPREIIQNALTLPDLFGNTPGYMTLLLVNTKII